NPADNTGALPWQRSAERLPYRRDPEEKSKTLGVLRSFIKHSTARQLDQMRALHDVVRLDLPAEVKSLLEKGVAVDGKDKEGRTPLHVAALERRAAMVELLAKHKPDLNPLDKKGLTPLHYATEIAGRREVTVSGQLGFGGPGPDFDLQLGRP